MVPLFSKMLLKAPNSAQRQTAPASNDAYLKGEDWSGSILQNAEAAQERATPPVPTDRLQSELRAARERVRELEARLTEALQEHRRFVEDVRAALNAEARAPSDLDSGAA
jgi:hypothetical protein